MFAKLPYPVSQSETVVVKVINPTARKFKFSDSETILINRKIQGMILHSDALVKTRDSDDVVPNAIQKKALITLANTKGELMIKELPLEVFFNALGPLFLELDGMQIDLRKSFIDVPDTTGLTPGMGFVITFFFKD